MTIKKSFCTKSLGITFLILIYCGLSQAKMDIKADVFEQGSKRTKKLYTFEHQVDQKEGGLVEINGAYVDPTGNQVFSEKTLLKGGALVKSEIDQKQTQQKGSIERVGDEILFSLTESGAGGEGKTKVSKEKFKGSLVVPENLSLWVKENWAALVAGETLDFRFGVWDRSETVGFKFFKISEETLNGQKIFVFKMKASSFVIAAIVDPIIFKYTAGGEKIISYEGRVAPKKMIKKGDFAPLDAEIVYTYLE